jgi:hypothetical protein
MKFKNVAIYLGVLGMARRLAREFFISRKLSFQW